MKPKKPRPPLLDDKDNVENVAPDQAGFGEMFSIPTMNKVTPGIWLRYDNLVTCDYCRCLIWILKTDGICDHCGAPLPREEEK